MTASVAMPAQRAAAIEPGEQEPSDAVLSPSQLRIVRMLALGYKRDTIIAMLGIGRATYYGHTQEARRRYGAATMPELWSALGWLKVP